ncbi:MAG: class I SAM-dependent rRNA methyltransferase [Verrucomicrobia bacterium]|nr:class I SAM-dependent rRNA methyltransferase [Verrucomicrobiota bacterium]
MTTPLDRKIRAAIARRSCVISPQTNACRLFNAARDGLDGVTIDDFAGRWLLSTKELDAPALPGDLVYRSLYIKFLSKGTKTAPRHAAGEKLLARFPVQENGVSYWIDFQAGYSQGLFLDQRLNRSRLRELSPGCNVLNTFAYTCAFGVVAALAGGNTVNLDLSRAYLDWGRDNYRLNQLDPEQHDFIYGDVFDWLGRFAKRKLRFDFIVLDPPTFSRNRKSGVFRAEDDYSELLELALRVLRQQGIILCCLNAHHISATQFKNILKQRLPPHVDLRQEPMPEDFPGSNYLKTFWVFL